MTGLSAILDVGGLTRRVLGALDVRPALWDALEVAGGVPGWLLYVGPMTVFAKAGLLPGPVVPLEDRTARRTETTPPVPTEALTVGGAA